MKLLAVVLFLGLGGVLVAEAPVSTTWPVGGDDALDPSVQMTFSLDVAGPLGIAEFAYNKGTSVQIQNLTLVLSMDGGPMFCQEIRLDLAQATATNAVLRNVKSDKGRTSIEFTSTLSFVRKQAGLLSFTYSVAGEVKTAYNDKLLESRLLGRWLLAEGDAFPVVFRADHTVVWGQALPWRVANGLLTIGNEPFLQENRVELNGEQVTLRGKEKALRFVRDFGSDQNQPQEPVSARTRLNKLKAPEDYEFEEVGQRVNGGGAGTKCSRGSATPKR